MLKSWPDTEINKSTRTKAVMTTIKDRSGKAENEVTVLVAAYILKQQTDHAKHCCPEKSIYIGVL